MKNKLRFFLVSALTFVLACLTPAPAAAADYDFTVDGVYYKVVSMSELTCRVTSGSGRDYTGDVVIPEKVDYGVRTFSVTEIGEDAFYQYPGLTSVTIPNSVTTIGRAAFWDCTGLSSITIGNSVTTIGVFAFSGCTGLTSVTIPNSVTEIGRGAFSGSGLTSVTIPSPVTKIGDNAFYYCTGLTSVTIGNSVTEIGDYAFCGCTGLTSVTIGNSVTEIGNYAFSGCTGLTSVTIPNSVTTIGDGAFNRCTGLTSVTCLAKTPPIAHSDTFSDNTYLWATLYVPTGTSAAYSSVDGWKNFLIKEIDVPDAIKDITLDQNGENTIFDLQGHRLAQPKKGINIINGKKVLVK